MRIPGSVPIDISQPPKAPPLAPPPSQPMNQVVARELDQSSVQASDVCANQWCRTCLLISPPHLDWKHLSIISLYWRGFLIKSLPYFSMLPHVHERLTPSARARGLRGLENQYPSAPPPRKGSWPRRAWKCAPPSPRSSFFVEQLRLQLNLGGKMDQLLRF